MIARSEPETSLPAGCRALTARPILVRSRGAILLLSIGGKNPAEEPRARMPRRDGGSIQHDRKRPRESSGRRNIHP